MQCGRLADPSSASGAGRAPRSMAEVAYAEQMQDDEVQHEDCTDDANHLTATHGDRDGLTPRLHGADVSNWARRSAFGVALLSLTVRSHASGLVDREYRRHKQDKQPAGCVECELQSCLAQG